MVPVVSEFTESAVNANSVNECAGFPKFRKRHLLRRWCDYVLGCTKNESDKKWTRSIRGHSNKAMLEALRGRHWGKRCFVLGNGPSLNKLDLTLLRDEYVIGTNRIYLHEACKQWRRWYYCAVNPNVIGQFESEISSLDTLRFMAWEHRDKFHSSEDTVWLRTSNEPRFSFDLSDGMWQGATVTYVAMQVAFHLGFTDVVLLGVDHHYDRAGQPNKLVRSGGDDPDHFAPGYFGNGCEWQLPDLEQSELAYRLARLAYEQEGRRIRDATVDGRLEVFPKTAYEDLF
jgi:hypothetical protein